MFTTKKLFSLVSCSFLIIAGGCMFKKTKKNDTAALCAPYETPEELNKGYMREYSWRFEKFDTQPMSPDAQNVFNAHSKFAPGKRVLDIGAGPGHFAAWMVSQGFSVDCIDPFDDFKTYCENKGLPFICTAAINYVPATLYDIVVGIGWPFNHINPESAPAVLSHIATKILKKDGIAIITFFIGDGITYEDPMKVGHQRSFVHYTEDECRKMLMAHFKIISTTKHFLNSIKKDVCIFACKNT